MASVARAIEQAASCTLDDSLWWDSHESLFHFLDDYVSGFRKLPAKSVLDELQRNQTWLLGTFLRFGAPNAKSRSALDVAKVVLGSHTLEINAEVRNLTLQISKKLVLDEVQTYILVDRCFDDARKPNESDLVQKVILKYFTERQCLLKCLRLLLLSHMAESFDSFAVEPIDQLVNCLIEGGLESNIFRTLENLLTTEQTWDLGLSSMNLWAEEISTEVNLVMDILFLLYYKPLCSCSFNHWKDLFMTFQAKILCGSIMKSFSVTEEATKLVEYIKHQAVLILLEILDLDKLLLMVFDDVPFRDDRYPFSIQELQQMDELFSQLNVSEVQEYGPLLLGWGTLGCLISFLPTKDQNTLEIDHITYIQHAHQGKAFCCLLDMVQHRGVQGSNIDGYKCVIKSVISSFCASYDITHQSDSTIVETIVEILHSIYLGQEVLCIEFWDRESILDSPLRNLLYSLRECFPYQLKPLVKLLAGLAEGTWPAECVYSFLCKPSEITCASPNRILVSFENENQFTNAAALEVSGVPALLIPIGTVGYKLKELDDQTSVVLWKCKHIAIIILLLRLSELCISEDSWPEAHLIVNLLHRMLSSNKMLAEVILMLDGSEACKEAKIDGRIEEMTRVNPLAVTCMLLDKLIDIPGRNATAALCMDILGIFSGCCPLKVMHELSNVQSKGSIHSFMDTGLLAKSLACMYKDFERSNGTHPLIIGVLNLCASMITKGIMIKSLENIVIHIVGNLFVNHMTWKYAERYERWKITTKVFEIGQLVLSDSRPNMLQLRVRVLEVIMVDGAFHSTVLRILSTTENDLRGLYFSRFADSKEIEWFERALCSGLTLLQQALSTSLSSSDTKSNTPLEHAVMHHTVGTAPFILCVASLTGLFQNQAMQVASIKMLTTLCHVSTKARPHPINILSYFQEVEQKRSIRRTLRRLLSKEMAELNLELYTLALDLLVTATRCQVSFVEMLLCPHMLERLPCGNKLTAQGEIDDQDENYASICMPIREILSEGKSLLKSEPQILCPILYMLKNIWEIGLEFPGILEVFQRHDDFWVLIVAFLPDSLFILEEDTISDEWLARSYVYQCQTFVLEIVACEFFLQQCRRSERGSADSKTVSHILSGTRKHGKELTLLQVIEAINPIKLKFSIFKCHYDNKVVKRARAEMRALIVSLLLKILTNDELGLSSPLLGFLQQALKMVVDHPAFQGILSNYLSHGYGSGKDLQILVMNDLYFHLQGELEAGRHVPAGAFKDLVSLLDTLDIAPFVFNSKERGPESLQALHDRCSLYDTTQLREHLGLQWWSQTPVHIVQTAVNTLDCLQQANSMACLGTCQVSALDAICRVLALFITTKEEVGTGIKESWTASCITELCTCICESLKCLAPDGDPTRYVESLISAQSHLLDVLMKWFGICMTSVFLEREVERICPKVMSTFLATMRTMWNTAEPPEAQVVTSVLGAWLTCLSLMQRKCRGLTLWELETKDSAQNNDAVSDVEEFSMEFLPILCTLVEEKCNVHLTIAVTSVLIRNFLAPQIWLQVFESHSVIGVVLVLLHTVDIDTAYEVLNFLLCLCHFRKGMEMLLSAGFFSHILTFMTNLKEEAPRAGELKDPFQVRKARITKYDLWTVCTGIVAAIVKSLGEDNRNTAIENAFMFLEAYKEFVISALESPHFLDTDGIKRAKFGHREITTLSLEGTQQVIHLLAALMRHESLWSNAMSRSQINVRHHCIHLLAYIAREAPMRNVTGGASTILHCIPVDKLEVVAQTKVSLIGSSSGWFSLAAKGVSSSNKGTEGETVLATEFSDSIAQHMYKIALLLLQFLLKEAQYAVALIDEGNTSSSRVVPEFPAPEILYGLQDQAMSVITDICRKKSLESERQQACILMISILEKALFLELCVLRLCGIGPSTARSEDFMREFKRLLEVVEGNEVADAHLKTLKSVAVFVYPALT